MGAWEAEIKPPGGDSFAFPVAGLKAVARLGAEARLDLGLSSYLPERLEIGTKVVLRNAAGSELKLVAAPGNGWSLSAARDDLPSAGRRVGRQRERWLCQRQGEQVESAGQFVRRAVGVEVAWRSETMEWMDTALPEYACLAAPAFFPAEARLARILAAAGARASRAAAWFGPLSGEYRLRIVDDDPDSANPLDSDWRVMERTAGGTAVMERLIDHDADPDGLARSLCFETETTLGGKADAPPVVPGLVEFDERFWFATEATTEIHFDTPTPGNPRGRTTLQLSDWSTFVAETQAPRSFAQVYLGVVVGTHAEGEWGLLHIRPPSEDEDTPAFPRWAAVDGEEEESEGLLAFEAAPAPTTGDVCALHVRRRPGDPVVFVVNDAGPPVVLGALSGHCDYAEEYDVHVGRGALVGGVLHVE